MTMDPKVRHFSRPVECCFNVFGVNANLNTSHNMAAAHVLDTYSAYNTQIASGAEISRLIKTLTSDNVRDMSRKLGRSSHAHPLVFAEKVLNQLERSV